MILLNHHKTKRKKAILMYQNYTIGQTALTLNLDFAIPHNHLANTISWFVDSIPEDVLLGNTAKTGRPAYHPAMMLKILLFAYSRRVFSGRKIELMLEENVPMMALAEHQQISYHTINNFRSSKHANELVKKSFLYFTNLLEAEGLINEGAIFIDGTKIEADANRYTFVWRKAVEKFHDKLKGQAVELYDELIAKEVVKAMAKEKVQTSQGLAELAQETEAEIEKLTEEIEQEPKAIPGGSPRKARRRGLKKLLHKLRKDYVPRMKKYEEAKEIFAGRNSYSKTDHDATFMHMKEDHMKNGQLKPGYNIQAATTDQYVVDFALYPNPTDFRTFEPFLKQMTTLDKFDKIVADAGYGSEYNYSMLEEEYSDKKYYIPYTMYEKEKTRKYRNDPTKLANWFYDEKDDYYLDQNGVRFNFKYYSQRKDRSTGQVRDFKVYEADEFQLTPELERLAKTKSGRQRQVRYNPNWQYLKEKAKAVLQSPEGRHIYSMRKYDVEPIFGHLKNVFGMRRTHLRGKKKVETDIGIAFMMMNLSKYWNRRWSKDQFSLFKNKNRQKKTVKQLKLRVGLIVFQYLRVSFFPDTYFYHSRKNMQTASYYNSPIGKILLASDEQGLIGLWLDTDRYYGDNLDKEYSEGGNKYLASAKKWLDIYFQGKEPDFTPQLHLIGTDFQKRVWQALLKIPYGMTTTYKDIAVQAAKDKDHLPIRAAGGAIGRNHICIIIPCHRVVGANHNLTGYGGGIDKKIQLLKLEGVDINQFKEP